MNLPTFIGECEGKELVAGFVGGKSFFSLKDAYMHITHEDLKTILKMVRSKTERFVMLPYRDNSYFMKENEAVSAFKTPTHITLRTDSITFWGEIKMTNWSTKASFHSNTVEMTLPLDIFKKAAKSIQKGDIIGFTSSKEQS